MATDTLLSVVTLLDALNYDTCDAFVPLLSLCDTIVTVHFVTILRHSCDIFRQTAALTEFKVQTYLVIDTI